MLYWDTSALFAFLITEKHSAKLRSLVQQQGSSTAYTAIITPLEFESAIQRRLSERTLNLREADRARLFGVDFRKQAYLVPLDQNALDTALHLQKIYGLRPGDAIQLASARLGTDNPSRVVFLCLDEKLTEAAKREGFQTQVE
jgi:predicted nucleic acid-binding protein